MPLLFGGVGGSAISVCFTVQNRRSTRRKRVDGVLVVNPNFVDTNLSASPVPLQRYTPVSMTGRNPDTPEAGRAIVARLRASQPPDVTPQVVEPVVKLACKPEAPDEVEMAVSCESLAWVGYFVVIQGSALDGFHPEVGTTFEGHRVYR